MQGVHVQNRACVERIKNFGKLLTTRRVTECT